jgi:CRP-like cAMP-binding protein
MLPGIDGQLDFEEQRRIMEEIRQSNLVSMKDRNKVRINTVYLKKDIECVD